MTNEPAQDRSVVLAVVMLLGGIATAGMIGMVVLIFKGVDAGSIALIGSQTSAAIGALAGILASTRSTPSAVSAQAEAVGYQKAVSDVEAMAVADPGPVALPAS